MCLVQVCGEDTFLPVSFFCCSSVSYIERCYMGAHPLLWTPGLISYGVTLEGGNRESLLLLETQHT